MSKKKNVFVISEDKGSIASLVTAAKSFGESVTLIFSGERSSAVGADKAYYLGELKEESFLNYIPSILELCRELVPELILTDVSKNGRLIAGVISGTFGAGIVSDVSELSVEDSSVTSVRMVYGGTAFKTEVVSSPMAVACVGAGVFEAAELAPCEDVNELVAKEAVRFVQKRPVQVAKVNLSAAKKIVAAGRGVADESVLADVCDFARALGAEVGCTRPIAEEQKWMPKETYIGVSGAMLKPEVYFGLGVSGQIQHMVGINSANTIIAVNKDKNAPIFQQCDYGLVANLTDILPGLKERLK